jgi:hypothetical protein
MEFNYAEIEPKQSNWLELNVRYEGHGKAEFTSPAGQVLGPFVAEFSENGDSRIETEYESLIPEDPDYHGADIAFVTGAKVQKTNGGRAYGIGGIESKCKELSFSTPDGLFTASSVRLAGYTFGKNSVLRFRIRDGKFETKNTNIAKYFVIPLMNFVGEPHSRLLSDHPLRIYPTPTVPQSVPEQHKFSANFLANKKNHVVAFLIDGRLHFIERVADYEERYASLESGTQRSVTAVLVGEIGSHPVASYTEFFSWFPSEMLSALGFASGTEVGRLWVEIRDKDGELIRRLHGKSQLPTFWLGDEVLQKIDQMNDSGALGQFVAAYLSQPPEKRFYLEMAMNHARLGSIGSHLHLHDILDHLIRGLEGVCREHMLVQQNLKAMLSVSTKANVQQVVDEATKELQNLATNAANSGALGEQRTLNLIKSRAHNWHTTDNNFGLSVVGLLSKFGLCDAEVIDNHLIANPRPDGIPNWAAVISAYRNATIHEGYLDFKNKHDASDVAHVCVLLKDALSRVLLKECGYSGTYTPPIRRSYGPQSLAWVQASTPASNLGFQ